MPEQYRETIARLIRNAPFKLDPDLQLTGRPPSMASSEFLTNKEQGDWAEQIVHHAINDNSTEYFAVRYGRSDSLAAGDDGFKEFYEAYQHELNTIGKLPDLLIFRRSEFDPATIDLHDDSTISEAVAAIEVRSSSFLAKRYQAFMESRTNHAIARCKDLQQRLCQEPYANLLLQKSPAVFEMIKSATVETFRDITFRRQRWSSSDELAELSDLLSELKDNIKSLHRRDYLSITPKIEDLVLVNRWIQKYNVRHYYLQVFFDKAYVIPFFRILEISSDSSKEGIEFSIERDVKNQRKTTIKINVQVGKEILGRIDMPAHRSKMKELDRGRLLFFVTFDGGKGYLDHDVFVEEIVNDS
jgi:hypothetical protein